MRAQGRKQTKSANTLQAIPTLSHMALVELQNRGLLKYLISQNCDGLHRRSGMLPVCLPTLKHRIFAHSPKEMISELHGNSNREYCKDCDKEYMRGQPSKTCHMMYLC